MRATFTAAILLVCLVAPALFGQAPAEAPPPAEPPAVIIDAAEYPDLQAAFDAVPKAGGLVKLPPGEFRLTKPLVLARDNMRVVGSGAATRLVNLNTEGQPALVIRPANLEKDKNARIWRVQLADFRVDGDPKSINNKGTEPKGGVGILAQNVDEIYIAGMTVDHHGGHGLSMLGCLEDARIVHSVFTYNRGVGINLEGCHDIVVNANQFEENQDALRCVDSFNLCMNGNNIDDHLGNGVIIENTYGSVLSGNMIEECKGTAVILDRDCYGITISSNVLADNFGGGVDLRDAWGCTVSANTFTIDAIQSLIIRAASGRITVTGNTFADSYIGDGTRRIGRPNAATGILLEGTREIVISGNMFSGLGNAAVKASTASHGVVMTGNIVTGLDQMTDAAEPAVGLAAERDVVLENNLQADRPAARP